MFELYTFRSRRVMLSTRFIAGEVGAPELDVAALGKAIVAEDAGTLYGLSEARWREMAGEPEPRARFFAPEATDRLIADLNALLPHGTPVAMKADMSLGAELQRVLEETERLRAQHELAEIEPLLLLAAILRVDTGAVRETFARHGVTRSTVDAALGLS